MKLNLVKTLGGLKPAFDSDKEQYNKIPNDTILEFDVKVPRNLQLHKKYFALLNLGYQNQSDYKNFDWFRQDVLIAIGQFHEKVNYLEGGVVTLEAKSIKFSSMGNDEFNSIYEATLDFLSEKMGVGTGDILKELENKITAFY